jgi:hypothetical protein
MQNTTPTRKAEPSDLSPVAHVLTFPKAPKVPNISATPRVEGTSVVTSAIVSLNGVRLVAECEWICRVHGNRRLGQLWIDEVHPTPKVTVNGKPVSSDTLVDWSAADEEAVSLAYGEFEDAILSNARDC